MWLLFLDVSSHLRLTYTVGTYRPVTIILLDIMAGTCEVKFIWLFIFIFEFRRQNCFSHFHCFNLFNSIIVRVFITIPVDVSSYKLLKLKEFEINLLCMLCLSAFNESFIHGRHELFQGKILSLIQVVLTKKNSLLRYYLFSVMFK